MPEKMKIVKPNDPEFKKLMEQGKIVSGADLNEKFHAWSTDQPGPNDEVVQPNVDRNPKT